MAHRTRIDYTTRVIDFAYPERTPVVVQAYTPPYRSPRHLTKQSSRPSTRPLPSQGSHKNLQPTYPSPVLVLQKTESAITISALPPSSRQTPQCSSKNSPSKTGEKRKRSFERVTSRPHRPAPVVPSRVNRIEADCDYDIDYDTEPLPELDEVVPRPKIAPLLSSGVHTSDEILSPIPRQGLPEGGDDEDDTGYDTDRIPSPILRECVAEAVREFWTEESVQARADQLEQWSQVSRYDDETDPTAKEKERPPSLVRSIT